MSIVVFVTFNVILVIVMLNVLIAIVSDSYDKAVARSRHLFLRSRLELAAELVLVLPPGLLRDAGFGLARGDMLSLLLSSRESRADGTARRIGGARHFVSSRDGYGAAGCLFLLCAATVFSPLTLAYAGVRFGARRLGGDAAAAATTPERLLATPDVKADDDEYLGRIGEIERIVKRSNESVAERQRQLEQKFDRLDTTVNRLDATVSARFGELATKLDTVVAASIRNG